MTAHAPHRAIARRSDQDGRRARLPGNNCKPRGRAEKHRRRGKFTKTRGVGCPRHLLRKNTDHGMQRCATRADRAIAVAERRRRRTVANSGSGAVGAWVVSKRTGVMPEPAAAVPFAGTASPGTGRCCTVTDNCARQANKPMHKRAARDQSRPKHCVNLHCVNLHCVNLRCRAADRVSNMGTKFTNLLVNLRTF